MFHSEGDNGKNNRRISSHDSSHGFPCAMSMKIVVLAGGLSTERAVSLVTGSSVCRALRENGHRAILVDLFLGMETLPSDPETLFDSPDGLCPDAKIEVTAPDIEAVKRSRKDQSGRLFGPNVLELCSLADIVFLGLHGQDGEDGRVQAVFDLLGIRYTGGGYLASGLAMDKAMTKRMMDSAGIPTAPWRDIPSYTEADIPAYNALVLDGERNRWWGYDDVGGLGGPVEERSFFDVARKDFEKRQAVNFAVRLDGKLIGEAVLYRFDCRGGAELGCRIDGAYAGHGYGTEAFTAVAEWALYKVHLLSLIHI